MKTSSLAFVCYLFGLLTFAVPPSIFGQSPSGVSWEVTNEILGGDVHDVGVLPFGAGMWVSIPGRGLYISRNRGATWFRSGPASVGIPISAASDGSIYTITHAYTRFRRNFLWLELGRPSITFIQSIAAGLNNDVFGSSAGVLYRLDASGRSWSFFIDNVKSVSSSPWGRLIISTRDPPDGFRFSDDGGLSWSDVRFTPQKRGLQLVSGPDDTLYTTYANDIWTSRDGGESWQSTFYNCGAEDILGVDYLGRLYTYSQRAGIIARYTSDLSSCTIVSDRIGQPDIRQDLLSAAVGPQGDLLVSYSPGLLFISKSGGDTWMDVDMNWLSPVKVHSLMVEQNRGLWWAATDRAGLLRSYNEGSTWDQIGFGSNGLLAVEKGTGTGHYWAVVDEGGLYRTIDGGFSWHRADRGLEYRIRGRFGIKAELRYDKSQRILYVYSPWLADLYYSRNDGLNWHPMNVPYRTDDGQTVYTIELSKDGFVYAAIREPSTGAHAIYRTSDQGGSWRMLSPNFPIDERFYGLDTRILSDEAGWLWVSLEEHIYYSSDRGENWIYSASVPHIITDFVEGDGGIIWAAHEGGIIVTSDRGNSWTSVTTGILDTYIPAVAWDSNRNVILAGTGDQGVYRGEVDLSVVLETQEIPLSERPDISAIAYPNPFSATTTIRYNLAIPSFVSLTVHSVDGRLLRELEAGFKLSGEHEVIFSASGLSPGIYFYTLKAGAFTQTRKIVVVR
ncbi:MAG: hypothetical protein BMS9Abin05_2470 [Rhodothermia bacterium]|nr:MAG: hypothetical protein BMS9Abin05_2470 [Rhodothermia bacterium]